MSQDRQLHKVSQHVADFITYTTVGHPALAIVSMCFSAMLSESDVNSMIPCLSSNSSRISRMKTQYGNVTSTESQ